MNKISTTQPKKLYFTYPNTVAVICVKCDSRVFVMPAVWQIPLSHSPAIFGVLVSPKRNTYGKIIKSRNFSLNYFTYKHAYLVNSLGSCTGASTDKIKKFNIQLSQSKYIESPILDDAFVSIECDNVKTKLYGDHRLFAGYARNIWYDTTRFSGDTLDLKKASPLLYLGNRVYTSTDSNTIIQCKTKKES